MNSRRSRLITPRAALLLVPAVLATLAGCAPIEPWVKPYERERLADPIMALETTCSSLAKAHAVEWAVRAAAAAATDA
jgi:hypothetical protein